MFNVLSTREGQVGAAIGAGATVAVGGIGYGIRSWMRSRKIAAANQAKANAKAEAAAATTAPAATA